METILIWIVLFLLAGVFLVVIDRVSSARTMKPEDGDCKRTPEHKKEALEEKRLEGAEEIRQRAILTEQKSIQINRSTDHQAKLREQRAHALSVERFIEEERKARVESHLKKAEKRKARVERQLKKAGRKKARVELQLEVQEYKKSRIERQREVEEKRKARFANLKPKSYKAAEAFISALSWAQVEQLAVDLLEHKGWSATRTKPGADKSIDAIATKTGENRTAVVQVKDWKKPVSGPTIRETIGAAAVNGISEIFVITTGRFTSDAQETAEEYDRQSHKNDCELWDGGQLITTIINMPNDQFLNMVISEGEISSTYQLALNEGYAAELNS